MRLYDLFRLRFSAKRLALWGSAALLLGSAQVAHAVSWDKSTDFRWNATTGKIDVFPGQGTGNIWATGTKAASSAGPTFSANKALPFNPSPTAKFKAVFTPANMARAITRPVVPLILGAALTELANQACVRLAGGVMTNNGSTAWEECNMVTQSQTEYKGPDFNGWVSSWATSRLAACQSSADVWKAYQQSSGGNKTLWVSAQLVNNGLSCNVTYGWTDLPYVYTQYAAAGFSTRTANVQVQDGWKTATDTVAEGKISQGLTTMSQADFSYGTSKSIDVLNNIIDSGNPVQVSTISVDPIANIVSQPVTTTSTVTNADGSTSTLTKTSTTTNSYTITNNNTSNISITQNTSTSSTTTNQAGQTVATETTTKPPEQSDDFCTKYPESVGCQKLDTPTENVPKSTQTLTYAAENLGFGGGACPAPIGWSDSLGSHSINLAPLCDKLTGVVRPLVIAFALLAAVFIIMPGKTEA